MKNIDRAKYVHKVGPPKLRNIFQNHANRSVKKSSKHYLEKKKSIIFFPPNYIYYNHLILM